MAFYVSGPVSTLCVCVSGIHAQLCYWLNWQTGKWQRCPSAWVETPGPQAELHAGAARQDGAGLEQAAMLLT